ncbi:MAG: hypothetical protein V7739_04225 [Motiliproteus sp.]
MDKQSFIRYIIDMPHEQYDTMLRKIGVLENSSAYESANAENEKKTERVKVDGSLSLFRQTDKTRNWSARVVIDKDGEKTEKRFSTGKASLEEARIKAIEERFKLIGKVEAGYSIETGTDLSFRSIARKAISEMQAVVDDPSNTNTTYVDYISLLNNHIIEYFGDVNIKNVDYPMLIEYFDQTSVRSKSRITMQKTSIKKVFDYAVKKRLVGSVLVPEFPKEVAIKDPDYRVEPFSEHDLHVIKDNYSAFVESSRKEKTKHYRRAFQHYFSFVLSTGVRPGEEPRGIKFKDISKHIDKASGSHFYIIRLHKGKTQKKGVKYRDIAVDATAIKSIEYAAKELNGFLTPERIDYLIKKYPEKHVFFSYVNNAFPSYDRIFSQEQYLGYVGDKLHYDKYKSYSCRHTYINNQLAHGINHNDISEHCGTSIQVIETHYKKAKIKSNAPEHIEGNIVDYHEGIGVREGIDRLKKLGLVT